MPVQIRSSATFISRRHRVPHVREAGRTRRWEPERLLPYRSECPGVKRRAGDPVMVPPFPAPAGFRWVFCAYFRHWRTGQIVYPKKVKAFAFLVRA